MSWIQTYTGKKFYPAEPKQEDIDIVDIAHSLSMQCRYNGHCTRFYSVAEHCVLMSRHHTITKPLDALMHDAAEAYLCDIPRPIKPLLKDYDALEKTLEYAIAQKYCLTYPISGAVREADHRMLFDERKYLMSHCEHEWDIERLQPLGVVIYGWSPSEAKRQFLECFRKYRRSQFHALGPR